MGPGRFLRPAQDLRDLREARLRANGTSWSSARGTTAAGRAATATGWARSSSARRRASTSATRSRRPGSPRISRTRLDQMRSREAGDVSAPGRTPGSPTTAGRPEEAAPQRLYARKDGRLAFEPPPADENDPGFDAYLSDPAHPVPYRPRPITPTYCRPRVADVAGAGPAVRPPAPRRPELRDRAAGRGPDLAGSIVAHLFASTTGTDSDWIVKLIDVYPEDDPAMPGYQLMIADEVFRGRFRKSFEKPEPIQSDRVEEYTIDLHWNDHCFKKGHKIMVQIQSTWFPLIDRNPQTVRAQHLQGRGGGFPARHAADLPIAGARHVCGAERPGEMTGRTGRAVAARVRSRLPRSAPASGTGPESRRTCVERPGRGSWGWRSPRPRPRGEWEVGLEQEPLGPLQPDPSELLVDRPADRLAEPYLQASPRDHQVARPRRRPRSARPRGRAGSEARRPPRGRRGRRCRWTAGSPREAVRRAAGAVSGARPAASRARIIRSSKAATR